MASDADIPFWRRRIVWLAAALVAVLTVVTVRSCRDVTGETFLRKRAEAFLTAGDREDFEACRKAGTLEEKQLRIYRLNRQSLGKLVNRSAARATPLKFGAKEGYLFTFVSRFAEADGIEERVAVLVEPESRKVEIFSVNYHYRRMPRPELKDSYPGTIPADVRAKTLRTGQAFDHGEWKYFEALGRREIGYERRGAGAPLARFQQRFGKATSRAPMMSVRFQRSLPGCVHLSLMRVTNRTGYRVKNISYDCEETVFFMLDMTAQHPEWQVYAFSPGQPKRITPLPKKRPAAKPAAKPAEAKPAAPEKKP